MTDVNNTEEQIMEEIFDLQTIKAIDESEGLPGEFDDYIGYVEEFIVFKEQYWE